MTNHGATIEDVKLEKNGEWGPQHVLILYVRMCGGTLVFASIWNGYFLLGIRGS